MLERLGGAPVAVWTSDNFNANEDRRNVLPAASQGDKPLSGNELSLLQDAGKKARSLGSAQRAISEKVIAGNVPSSDDVAAKNLAMHQLSGAMHGLDAGGLPLARFPKASFVMPETEGFARSARFKRAAFESGSSSEGADILASGDFKLWGDVAGYIGNINKEYLLKYQEIVAGYTEFYKKFSSNVLANLGGWVHDAGDKGDKVKIDKDKIQGALKTLNDEFSKEDKVLYTGEKAAEFFKDLTGKEAAQDTKAGGFWYWNNKIYVNTDWSAKDGADNGVLQVMIHSLDGDGLDTEMNSAKFQAWKSGFDSEAEQLKNTLQTLTQKYSNANSIFDNLVKVLSSTITACMETAKAFFQI
ncbi:IpaD/SipD/SspD family type III secretion system needle tip protein [Chromobacterium sp. IIBBL 290-4]|uniref:IpaD/SipD/SspD family type III secretion system needle tip protein n=1 Tax=Chromobacterium sp. IIBBL 290-4 TaxID=2953890 RepID=UPI0020B7DA86|nr:IpaD/SipD/SspD family type III secretion system needle tip protein [Chromobacterium sp. IIBBL 290-4]UTH74095.1 IpaD/SipD/SspD family type III secretion system needle tip protein [Chromobacterium sp. IIBBL 290-4]